MKASTAHTIPVVPPAPTYPSAEELDAIRIAKGWTVAQLGEACEPPIKRACLQNWLTARRVDWTREHAAIVVDAMRRLTEGSTKAQRPGLIRLHQRRREARS